MLKDDYQSKLRILSEYAWDKEVGWEEIEGWLENFDGSALSKDSEDLYALYALTQFMYFGKHLVREMLKALYRDHFMSPIKQHVRRSMGDSLDSERINSDFEKELNATRFSGVGNPAESGAHLLYYFRQINSLPKGLFSDLLALIKPISRSRSREPEYCLKDENISRIVFFDDLVGSGTQAKRYLSKPVADLKKNNPGLELCFLCLFATSKGIKKLNEGTLFNGKAICLFELDDSYKAFGAESRHFSSPPDWFSMSDLRKLATTYGSRLWKKHPLGFKNSQLLLGFFHNTPNNTPPIFWWSSASPRWSPVFTRYQKEYTVSLTQ